MERKGASHLDGRDVISEGGSWGVTTPPRWQDTAHTIFTREYDIVRKNYFKNCINKWTPINVKLYETSG
jgi:hypothetical protein